MSQAMLRFKNESQTVTTKGTSVKLKTITTHTWIVTIQANPDNVGVIFLGNDGSEDISSVEGISLEAGQFYNINANDFFSPHVSYIDLSRIYIDSSVDGGGVRFMYSVANV